MAGSLLHLRTISVSLKTLSVGTKTRTLPMIVRRHSYGGTRPSQSRWAAARIFRGTLNMMRAMDSNYYNPVSSASCGFSARPWRYNEIAF
jgi:hypothetical protein